MPFDTPVYFVFLTLVVIICWRLGWRQQNLLPQAASYFYYGWRDWRFPGLILIAMAVDFHCARCIASSENPWRRRLLLQQYPTRPERAQACP